MAPAVPLFAEVVGGLEDLARAELSSLGATSLEAGRDGLRLAHAAPFELVRELRLVSSVYRELRFAVPRPKALLGDQALRPLARASSEVAAEGGMTSFRFAAAGADSRVFQRLAGSLEATTGLKHDPREGSMLLRVRPYRSEAAGGRSGAHDPEGSGGPEGWEVLVRLTDRPLSTRPWRVCNRPGGINATVAVALNQLIGAASSRHDRPLTGPTAAADASYLNLMCGSGTLMVERAASGPWRRMVGVDIEQGAVDCARQNLEAAGVHGFELHRGDVAALSDELRARLGGPFDEITSDAPWGDAIGDHAANAALYPALLTTAAALARPGATFGLLSHEVRLLERLLPGRSDWHVASTRRLSHGGHNPVLVVLKRV